MTLTVTDARGAPSGPVTTTATIANAGPAVNAGVNQTATAGSAFALSASFGDPGVNDAPWAYAVDWGDGSPATTGNVTSQSSPIAATHTYAAAGTNVLRVTVTDKDGAAGVGSKSVTDVFALSAAQARKTFDATSAQNRELWDLAQKLATEAGEPVRKQVGKIFQKAS